MDNLTLEQRKKNMSHIRGVDTEAECILRKALWKRGYRYRKNYKDLPGKPDIVLTKYKIVVFCDGEFFHGKDWEEQKKRVEKSNNNSYWLAKIERNICRDKEINTRLASMGWTVLRFWSKDIKNNLAGCIQTIEEAIVESKLQGSEDILKRKVGEKLWLTEPE